MSFFDNMISTLHYLVSLRQELNKFFITYLFEFVVLQELKKGLLMYMYCYYRYLSKLNLVGTRFYLQKRRGFGLYMFKLTNDFLHWDFI